MQMLSVQNASASSAASAHGRKKKVRACWIMLEAIMILRFATLAVFFALA
jgi:hypothetical protein